MLAEKVKYIFFILKSFQDFTFERLPRSFLSNFDPRLSLNCTESNWSSSPSDRAQESTPGNSPS
jgi:hypothetical protein